MDKIVGIGDYVISNNQADFIKTFALASCVAVTVYNPFLHLAGMIHIALPDFKTMEVIQSRLGFYATSAIPLLIDTMSSKFGSRREDLQVKIFGGAGSLRPDDYFKIGEKNIKAVRAALLGLNLKIVDAHIGGVISRSITMSVLTGEIAIYALPIKI